MKLLSRLFALTITLCAGLAPAADAPANLPDAVPSGAATQPAESQEPNSPAALKLIAHLQETLRSVETVEADFVQTKTLAVLKHTLTIRGHFALQKPDRVIWIVREPVRYAIRVEGEEVRQWDEDTNKVQVIHVGGDPTFKAISEQIQGWFLGDFHALAQSYDVYVVGKSPLSLRFEPKAGTMVGKLIKSIQVTFAMNEMNVDSMVIREAAGDMTTLTFVGTRVNQPVKKETWEIPPR